MKNLLLASSVLAMTAGVAAAQDTGVSFGGELAFGIAINGTGNGGLGDNVDAPGLPNNQYHVYSTANLALTVAGTSDTGLSFGTTLELDAGPSYTLGDDEGFDENDGAWSSPAIFVTGSWGTVTFSSNDIDFYDDSAFNGGGAGLILDNNGVPAGGVDVGGDPLDPRSNTGDFQYEGTWGGLFTGLIVDIETGDASGKLSYNLSGFELAGDYSVDSDPANSSGGLWNASVGYTWQTFNFTLTSDNDNDDNNVAYGVKVGTTFAGIDGFVKYNFNPEVGATATDPLVTSYATWDLGAAYSNGPMTFTVEANNITEERTVNGIEWTVTADYQLASGVVVQAGTNYTGDAMLGAKFSF